MKVYAVQAASYDDWCCTENGYNIKDTVYTDKARAEKIVRALNKAHAREVLSNPKEYSQQDGIASFLMNRSGASDEAIQHLYRILCPQQPVDVKATKMVRALDNYKIANENPKLTPAHVKWLVDTFELFRHATVRELEVEE